MANLTEEQIRQIIRDELSFFIKSDRFIFNKPFTFLNNVHLSFGGNYGSKIGTDPKQKIALYGVTPVAQQGSISSPAGGATVDSQARSAINSLITAVKNFGITS